MLAGYRMSPYRSTPLTRTLFALGIIATLGACQRQDSGNTDPRTVVKAAIPIQRDIIEWDEYSGRTEATETVDIRSRVNGYLQQVLIHDGDKVHKGDLLFVIDRRNYEIELKRAEAELQRTRTRQQLAQNELKRADRLRYSKAISDEEYDQRSNSVSESTETLHAAEAALQMARLNLEFCSIRAPIEGRVGRELITAGNLVREDQTLLTTIVSTDPVYVYVDADEKSALRYRRWLTQSEAGAPSPSLEVELGLIDESGFPHHGHIDFIDPRLDSSTGTLNLRGIFPNPSEILTPGLYARVRIRASNAVPGLLIPNRAIGTDQELRYVWLAKPDGSIEYRKIAPGGIYGSFRQIRSGIEATDLVIVDGIAKLKPGARVKPETIDTPFDG